MKSQAGAAPGTRDGQPSASAIGSFMSGGLAWAIVEPSVNVTIECTIDCGCTTTSMRSYGMPNSRWVSISSRPLLTSDAEFSVFIGPIDQVGWAPACSGVTSSRSSAAQPRNGPPDAVSTRLATSSAVPPRRHCASAECSESTGTIWPGFAAFSTSGPPAISDSLFASASRAPLASAASVGCRPSAPTSALSTTSASVFSTSEVAASGPA